MNAKLKIDLKQGVVEVEGTEEFVAKIYADFKERVTKPASSDLDSGSEHKGDTSPKSGNGGEKKRPSAAKNKTKTPTFVKELNLQKSGSQPSLKDFISPFDAKSAFAWNLLFVYYMVKNERSRPITLDHVYTCYKAVGVKPPSAFYQSLIDTANKKGWLNTDNIEDISLSLIGENYVDHEFPKKEKAPTE